MKGLWSWIRYVVTPRSWPSRWQDRIFEGHINIGRRITVYGANAMHWAVNVWFRGNYWCFHPTTRTFGGRWPWKFYISPDATPSSAVFAMGPGIERHHREAMLARRAARPTETKEDGK